MFYLFLAKIFSQFTIYRDSNICSAENIRCTYNVFIFLWLICHLCYSFCSSFNCNCFYLYWPMIRNFAWTFILQNCDSMIDVVDVLWFIAINKIWYQKRIDSIVINWTGVKIWIYHNYYAMHSIKTYSSSCVFNLTLTILSLQNYLYLRCIYNERLFYFLLIRI